MPSPLWNRMRPATPGNGTQPTGGVQAVHLNYPTYQGSMPYGAPPYWPIYQAPYSQGNTFGHNPQSMANSTEQSVKPVDNKPEETEDTYMRILRQSLPNLSGPELREIILAVCLNSKTMSNSNTFNRFFAYIRDKEEEQGITIQNLGHGLAIHLLHFPPAELEGFVVKICEKDTSTLTRDTVRRLVQASETRKEICRSLC
ncbi:uncharacterized protein F4822DRAFT_327463 [Hypoxylon trugodes]|uniref:uncharacterized protein n=1 Tax=Hypoxylon trugodes TaxID=326681 RepID=UPI00219D5D4E|nr:uncharacterized protein F4822DRAFT_327463 [Hypoxylon trugodes]KAI1386836.1 hypothetical protein F4822DRAFT_327463 [Hypoxylon trugodes]